MEGNDKLERLLTSYILGELNEQDEAAVLESIKSDTQIRDLYEEIRRTLKLVELKHTTENVDVDREWSSFEEGRVRREYPTIFMNQAERFGNEIIKEVNFKRKTRLFRIVAIGSVAASVLLAIGWWSSLSQNTKNAEPLTVTTVAVKEADKAAVTRRLSNETKVDKQYFLQDGTEIRLAPNSEISFREPFESDKRDIRLTGSAFFHVAKDKTKPFTVFSGGISTTALGTSFTVTAFKNSNKIRVTLHEGKIVVKGVEQLKDKLKESFYLVPGEEFVFEKNKAGVMTSAMVVSSRPLEGKAIISDRRSGNHVIDNPSIPKFSKGSWYMFNNQSLADVLEQLKAMYKTEIIYSKNDVAKIYFIGTFNKTDSLEGVLRQIVIANGLKLSKENNQFIISK
ncbi:MAG TPA: FecR domain-containing protein [Flavitalea sp.]|nr:FecR domain-containing protein [Flavitalea sp.]